jgi:hypothetical protein
MKNSKPGTNIIQENIKLNLNYKKRSHREY